MKRWQSFVLDHGHRARAHHLSAVTGESVAQIQALRASSACKKLPRALGFEALFAKWHGRAPGDEEWPRPTRLYDASEYEWLGPEERLLATLVGQVGVEEIAEILTARLRQVTGDPRAIRSKASVIVRQNRIGLQSADVVGGILVTDAAREIGSRSALNHAIEQGSLVPLKVGRLYVIPHEAWATWKSQRKAAPEGYVRVASLKAPLGMQGTDKLAEHCKAGHIPTAILCRVSGTKGSSSKFGTWFMDGKVAQQLIADREAGRPMPWHGKPYASNLRATWKLLVERRHPAHCEVCRKIWGAEGSPTAFEDYARRYPPLAHGEKRHLTRVWTDGLSISEVAMDCGVSEGHVRRAITAGALRASDVGGRAMVTRTDATLWKSRRCPTGDNPKSWISLDTAKKRYGFSEAELRDLIADKRLEYKAGVFGAQRGVEYVLRQQCAELRADEGYTLTEAAARLKVTESQMRLLLDGLDWRKAARIPAATVSAARKRLEAKHGLSLDEAAIRVGRPLSWIESEIRKGTARVLRVKWHPDRLYLTDAMVERLKAAAEKGGTPERLSADWLHIDEASMLAGVSMATLTRWAEEGLVERQSSPTGMRYPRRSVMEQARTYWPTARFKRARWPQWLLDETLKPLAA